MNKDTIIKYIPTKVYLNLRWWDFKVTRRQDFLAIQKLRVRETTEWGSYKPFDEKKAIFVHIPKCAGVSVNKALFGNLAGGHTTLDQYINVYEPSLFLDYFKFTIVRNPWDRVVSAYSFLKKGGMNKWDSEFYQREMSGFLTFKDFVMGWLNETNINKHHHFRPQLDFIVDKHRKVTVDFIGYLENIDEDFDFISSKIGVNKKIDRINTVPRDDYMSFYDEESARVIEDIYRNDISKLNYHFSGVTEYQRKIHL